MNEVRSSTLSKPGFIRVAGSCSRCGGAGGFRGWPGFTCFRCLGRGMDPEGIRTYAYPASWTAEQVEAHVAARAAKAQAAADRKAAKKAAEAEAVYVANVERFPALLAIGEGSWHVARDIAHKARTYPLSEAQGALVTRVAAEDAAKAADAAIEAAAEVEAELVECPEGKLTLTGEVLTVKWQDSGFGGQLKMLVECGGFKVWGTVPASISPERGDLVEFNCSVERSGDDASFGFFKRPTKARILTVEVAV